MPELSLRQFLIIKTLKESTGSLTSSLLCDTINISPRTLRYEIGNINEIIKYKLIQSDKNGYYIDSQDKSSDILTDLKIYDNLSLFKSIALKLLESNEISVYDITEELYTSESTVYSILKQLNPKMKQFSLEIVRKSDLIYIKGSEGDKRRMLAHFFFSEVNALATQTLNYNDYFTHFELSKIRSIIVEEMERLHLTTDDIFLKNIVISIAICLQRIINGYPTEDSHIGDIQEDSVMTEFLSNVCARFTEEFNVNINENDFDSMLVLITGSFKDISSLNTDFIETHREFAEKIEHILRKTVNHFRVDLDYSSFFPNFVLHVHFLLLRAKNTSFFKNDISASLRHSHPFIYDVSVYLIYQIEKEFNVKVSDDEIGLIAIYLGSVIQEKVLRSATNVICVIPQYHGLREMMMKKLETTFGERMKIVKCVSSFSEIKDSDEYDLIISSVESNQRLKKVVEVSTMITPREIRKIEKALLDNFKKKKKSIIRNTLLQYFDKNLFFYNHPFRKASDLLEHLNSTLLDMNVVDHDYLESVYRREELSSTAFFNRFAIPHSIDVNGLQTKVVYCYSEKPIQWYGSEVNMVIMLITTGYDEQFTRIYNLLFDVLLDNDLYHQMAGCKTFEELINYLEKKM